MIVILCETFYEAQEAFYHFLSYIAEYGSAQIKHKWEYCNCVETDEDLRYIFVDQRYGDKFSRMDPDIVGEKCFFKLLDDYIFGV